MSKKQTQKEKNNDWKIKGRELVFLLNASTLPQEIKESFIVLLPKMSLRQIERLRKILEAKYLDEVTRDIDREYQQKIKTLVQKLQKEKKESDQKFFQKINQLKKDFKI